MERLDESLYSAGIGIGSSRKKGAGRSSVWPAIIGRRQINPRTSPVLRLRHGDCNCRSVE
jgi:hypothetical protein